MNEEKIQKDYCNLDEKTFKEISRILKKYDWNVYDSLSCFVASIFNINRGDMLSTANTKDDNILHARQLFWTGLHYFCGKSYQDIARLTLIEGGEYAPRTIGDNINSFEAERRTNQILDNKYHIIKNLIKLKANPHYEFDRLCAVSSCREGTITFDDKTINIQLK